MSDLDPVQFRQNRSELADYQNTLDNFAICGIIYSWIKISDLVNTVINQQVSKDIVLLTPTKGKYATYVKNGAVQIV